MDCLESQKKIRAFIDEKMDSRETLEFIKHVQGCKDCMDELSIEYLVMFGVKQLDSDSSISFNLDEELKEKLESQKRKAKWRISTMRWMFGSAVVLAVIAGYLISTFFYH